VIGAAPSPNGGEPADGIGAFAGPNFDPKDIAGHLADGGRGARNGRGCRSSASYCAAQFSRSLRRCWA